MKSPTILVSRCKRSCQRPVAKKMAVSLVMSLECGEIGADRVIYSCRIIDGAEESWRETVPVVASNNEYWFTRDLISE